MTRQTWYSWDALADSMDRIANLNVDWLFPGHGMWKHIGRETYKQQMAALGPAMHTTGRQAWSQRAGTTYGWY